MGATLAWNIKTPEEHTVRVQHAFHSPRVLIYVDDRRILNRREGEVLWDAGFQYEFEVDGVPCRLEIEGICQLWVDGQLQEPVD